MVLADGSPKPLPPAKTESVQKKPNFKGRNIAHRLGGGSYGDVYMATIEEGEQMQIGTKIAVKVQNKTEKDATKTTEQNHELTFLLELKSTFVMKLLGWRARFIDTRHTWY